MDTNLSNPIGNAKGNEPLPTKTHHIVVELEAERQAKLERLKDKILSSFKNGDAFTPQGVTSLLLFLLENVLKNPNGIQLQESHLNTIYQLRHLLDDFEALDLIEQKLSENHTK